jgi:DNA-binding FadR family transcriptional regulator
LDPDILSWEYKVGPRDAFLYKLTEVRLVIEPAAAKLAAIRATEDEIAVIERAYQQMDRFADDIDAFIAADMQFHAGIVKASHNEILEQIVITIRDALVASRKVTLRMPNCARESLPKHYAILEGIKARDADAAHNAMATLINSVKVDIDRSIEFIEESSEG